MPATIASPTLRFQHGTRGVAADIVLTHDCARKGAMAFAPTILERAYELARSGTHSSVDTIRRQLKSERFENVDPHISGSVVVALRKLILEAKAA